MNFSENTTQQYLRAKEQVAKIRSFYTHAIIYFIFVSIFIWLNVQSGGFPWAIFPIAGWGLGIIGHAFDTFGVNIIFGKDWEAKKIKELMDQDSSPY